MMFLLTFHFVKMDVRVGCILFVIVCFGVSDGVTQHSYVLVGAPGIKGEKGDIGSIGPPGVPGEKGVPGLTGLTGLRGLRGVPGSPGVEGAQGPIGEPGIGTKGEKGDTGSKGESGPMGPKGECLKQTVNSISPAAGKTGEKGPKGAPGNHGNKGDKGAKGSNGSTGKQGGMGAKGPRGWTGLKGDTGPKGATGANGPQGIMGSQGVIGPKGDTGDQGQKGDAGPRGFAGAPGIPGVCPATCTITIPAIDYIPTAEGELPEIGEKTRPSSKICKFQASYSTRALDPYWITEVEGLPPLPVHCNTTNNLTCLILNSEMENITKISVEASKNPVWLSKSGFSMNDLNTISKSKMLFLKEQSDIIVQKIRFYLNNATFDNVDLRLLNWFEVVIGQNPSEVTPMHYTIENDGSMMIHDEEWNYIDVVIIDDAKRLPIVDIYIKNMSKDFGEYFIGAKLLQLCFG